MMYEHAARILAHIGQLWQLTVVDPGRPAGALQEGSAASPSKPTSAGQSRHSSGTGLWEESNGGPGSNLHDPYVEQRDLMAI